MARGAIFRSLPYRRSAAALRGEKASEHKKTILIALLGNVIIACAKLVAGLTTGSAAMLSESGHSFADCINEILLGVSIGRSRKPPDREHPLGYGRERFLWAFLAALASFVIGGCVSIALAVHQFSAAREGGSELIAWIVLAVAFLADGASFLQSFAQVREHADERKLNIATYLKRTSDPILRAIIVEDLAAIAGTILAAAGLLVSHLIGNKIPDSIASLLIGILLAFTAIGLARPLADYLIGRSLPEPYAQQVQEILESSPAVGELIGFQAVYTGPEEVVVAAKVRPRKLSAEELTNAMDDLDRRIRECVPYVADVFIDMTARQRDHA